MAGAVVSWAGGPNRQKSRHCRIQVPNNAS